MNQRYFVYRLNAIDYYVRLAYNANFLISIDSPSELLKYSCIAIEKDSTVLKCDFGLTKVITSFASYKGLRSYLGNDMLYFISPDVYDTFINSDSLFQRKLLSQIIIKKNELIKCRYSLIGIFDFYMVAEFLAQGRV